MDVPASIDAPEGMVNPSGSSVTTRRASADPPPASASVTVTPQGPSHPGINDLTVASIVILYLTLYLLLEDWLLLASAVILMSLYCFYIRRTHPYPSCGVLDLQQFLANIS